MLNQSAHSKVVCSGEVLLPEHLLGRLCAHQGKRAMISLPAGTTLESIEWEALVRTLDATGGERSRVADLLGVSRRTLYNKIERYNL